MNSEQVETLFSYLAQLGWLSSEDTFEELSASSIRADYCYLKLIATHRQTPSLVRQKATKLLQSGYTLREVWAGRPSYLPAASEPQLVFGHQRHFASQVRFATIACSQLGRDGRRLPNWPRLLDYCVRALSKDGWTLLIPDGTTLADSTLSMTQRTGITYARLKFPSKKQSCLDWLEKTIFQDTDPEISGFLMHVSPPICYRQENRDQQETRPALQDRFATAFAERLVVLYLRPKGKLHGLVKRRLQREREKNLIPSVRLVFSRGEQGIKGDDSWTPNTTDGLLSEGAVGWYVSAPEEPRQTIPIACPTTSLNQPVLQPMMRMDRFASRSSTTWPFLAHCTRGSVFVSPDESENSSHFRYWIEGYQQSFSPLETLCRIATERRLLGSHLTKRSRFRSISFSACRLPELLERRTFQSHLGRWDWEPYGFLIDATALRTIGARPVRYGTESEFRGMPAEEQPFFQPHGKSQQWEQEQEWRLPGDLPLDALPRNKVFLFCSTQREATKLASQFPWTVLYQR
ncbi:MAG: hypothetical protein ACE361_18120 [Aureliella sp.]